MKSSVNDIILGALESIGTPTRAEWAQDWPCQGVLVAELINATNLIHEGYIKDFICECPIIIRGIKKASLLHL